MLDQNENGWDITLARTVLQNRPYTYDSIIIASFPDRNIKKNLNIILYWIF